MASPINVGDAILLSQLAYRCFKSFKDGPVEFLEIQNLANSISEALQLLSETIQGQTDSTEAKTTAALSRIVDSCRSTLKYLSSILSKYQELDTSSTRTAHPDSRTFVKNWKRIKWTKEGGDLDKLKSTLTAHLSSLHLAVAARNGFKLNQIYKWFVDNLEGKSLATNIKPMAGSDSGSHEQVSTIRRDHVRFTVSRSSQGDGRKLICPRASFGDDVLATRFAESHQVAFACRCSQPGSSCTEISRIFFLDSSLPIRIITRDGRQAWQVYVLAPSGSGPFAVSLSNVDEDTLSTFLDQLYLLNCSRLAKPVDHFAMTDNRISTTGREFAIIGASSPEVSSLANDLLRLQIAANHTTFDIPSLTYLQLIQRKLVMLNENSEDVSIAPLASIHPQSKAELIIHDGHGAKYSCVVKAETVIRPGPGSRFVQINDVPCTLLPRDTNDLTAANQPVQCDSITMEFRTSSNVPTFLESIRAMQQELLVQHHRHPSDDESVVWSCRSGDRVVQGCYLRDPLVLVLENSTTQAYRLVLINADRTSSITVSLPAHVKRHLLTTGEIETEDTPQLLEEEFVAWFVQTGSEGTAIFRQCILLRELMLPA